MHIRAYLRASTNEQDANRAKQSLIDFAAERGMKIAAFYAENESGAKLKRPELFRLLSDSHEHDVLLIEQVDRLSRLTRDDWEKLKVEIGAKKVMIVALDLPTSHQLMEKRDDFTGWVLSAINGMMLDMLAAIARKDYEDRRRRQAEGIAKAKTRNAYTGRAEDAKRNAGIADMLKAGKSYGEVQALTRASRATIAKIAKRIREQAL